MQDSPERERFTGSAAAWIAIAIALAVVAVCAFVVVNVLLRWWPCPI